MSTSYDAYCLTCKHVGSFKDDYRYPDELHSHLTSGRGMFEKLDDINTQLQLCRDFYMPDCCGHTPFRLAEFIGKHRGHTLCVRDEYGYRYTPGEEIHVSEWHNRKQLEVLKYD